MDLPFWPFRKRTSVERDNSGQPLLPREAKELIIKGVAPPDIAVKNCLNLSNSKTLRLLPAALRALALDVSNCPLLEELPATLRVSRINADGCISMWSLPDGLTCLCEPLR